MAVATITLLVIWLERIDWSWLGVRVRIGSPARPLAVLLMMVALRAIMVWRSERSLRPLLARLPTVILLAVLGAQAITYIYYGVRVCGGLDSFGYVGASQLLATGRLIEPQPLASLLPYPEAPRVAAPLGFVVAADGTSRAPRFPLGLPILMAIAGAITPAGPFVVPLIMALATLGVAYAIASSNTTPASGLMAAGLLSASPTFVNGAIQPMSDVTATCWLLGALYLTFWRHRWPVAAGCCMGMAIWTRPALAGAGLALVVMELLAPLVNRQKVHLAFAAPLALVVGAFIAGLAALNHTLYGTWGDSGYGATSDLFALGRVGVNVWTYGRWLTYAHGYWLWAGLAIAIAIGRRQLAMWQSLGVAAAAAVPYLLYFTWDDWEAGRFVLPTLAVLLVITARGLMAWTGSSRWILPRNLVAVLLVLVFANASQQFLHRHGVYGYWRSEAKYPRLGGWVASHTSTAAVVIAGLHSGSLRYYANRETLRWDEMPSNGLVATVEALSRADYDIFVALDVPSEGDRFRERFRSDLDRLTLIPAANLGETQVYRVEAR